MRPDYDAEAIAEVLGVAVLRGTTDGSSAAPSFKMGRGQFRSPPLTVGDDFIIAVDDAALLIVESLTGHIRDPLGTSQPPSSVLIEKAVEKGLPRTALRHVAEGIAGDDKAKKALFAWGVVPKTTLERRDTQLSPQESERTGRIARLFVHARRALGTAAGAREFMTTPHPERDRRTPIEAAKTDLGTRRTERDCSPRSNMVSLSER